MNTENTAAAPAPQECWSADEEDFNSTSLGALLDNNDHLVVGSTVWSGEAAKPELSELCSAQDVIETMADRASDIAGEHADDYPDVSAEAKAKLDALLCAWIAEHCPPSFYTVTNVQPHTLTADDFTTRAD